MYLLLSITTRDGELEYTQYTLLFIKETDNPEIKAKEFMSTYWGEDTEVSEDYQGYMPPDGYPVSELDWTKEIPANHADIIKNYLPI